ncbi:chloride channel [Tuber brumale]|nr:chloride channel [Tuber brumale]
MIPSSSGGSGAPHRLPNFEPRNSSSSSPTGSPPPGNHHQPTVEEESDGCDSPSTRGQGHSVPLGESVDRINRITFKRRQRASSSRYSLFSVGTPLAATAPSLLPPEPAYSPYSSGTNLDQLHRSEQGQKDPAQSTLDPWSSEGPGRRVYDDLTAIDWIFEYTKERIRTRALFRRGGILGHVAQLWDSSQVWIVLIGTGLAAGLLAAGIDIVTNWLGDLKHGYCDSHFYLSREFCCLGLEPSDKCVNWIPWSQALRVTGSRAGSYIIEYLFYIIFSIVFAATASLLVTRYATYARHSGIPEIKTVLGGFVIRRFMGTWTLVIKSLGLCLAVASGLWLGKEGPLVHVACCCANLLMKLFHALRKNEARKREVLSAASAAGISVAFGSPIGGVLFSLEQLSYYFPDKTMWQSFVCAMVAAVTLQFMNPFRTGKLVLYQVKYTRGWHDFEMVPFAILGVLGGLYGAFFIKLNMSIAGWRKEPKFKKYPVTEVVIVAVITAIVNFPTTFMKPQSSELVANLFQECSPKTDDFLNLCSHGKAAGPILLLLLSALLVMLLASTTFGLQIPAGIILPSMAIGALYGRAMGMVVQAWQRNHPRSWIFTSCDPDIECVTPGVFAIIGAASALGGVTRMTVSIVVIMFELTGALTYVLPIMIAVMISKWVGDAFGKRGIYESWIQFKEYPFLDNRDDPVPDIPVREVMTRIEDLVVITEVGHTIDSLEGILASQPYKGFPVVSDTRQAGLVGYISRSELRFALDQARTRSASGDTECVFTAPRSVIEGDYLDLRPWMDQTPITLSPKSSLMLVANLFQKLGLRYVLFATHGLLQGVLTKKDVYFVLNAEENAVGVSGRLSGIGEAREGRRLLGGDLESEADEDDEVGLLGGGE